MDHFPAAIVVIDSHLLVEEWNRGARTMWGLTEEQVVGEPFFGLQIGLPLEALQGPVRACRAPGAQPVSLQVKAVSSAGHEFPCRVNVLPITGGQPETAAMLIMEDLTDVAP
jgi:two-component system CheB/CheR fusion protein